MLSFWSKACTSYLNLKPLCENGWKISNDKLECVWDSDTKLDKVEQTVQWYTKGCACKTGCTTNRCKCRKSKSGSRDGTCGPGCKCTNCLNVPFSLDMTNTGELGISFSDDEDPFSVTDCSELEEDIFDNDGTVLFSCY